MSKLLIDWYYGQAFSWNVCWIMILFYSSNRQGTKYLAQLLEPLAHVCQTKSWHCLKTILVKNTNVKPAKKIQCMYTENKVRKSSLPFQILFLF